MPNYFGMFFDAAKVSVEYAQALEVALYNSEGQVWVAGSFVYATLANMLHRSRTEIFNINFIVEQLPETLLSPRGWAIEKTKYGGPRFRHGSHTVDLVQLDRVSSIVRKGVTPNIQNYLTGVPLNVQSLVYDISRRKLEGLKGLSALETRVVEINDAEEAAISAKNKGITPDELARRTARILNFTAFI